MSVFITTPLLITDYYDSLISQLDIYTEETIKEYKEKGLPVKTNRDTEALNESFNDEETDEKYGVETLNNPYEPKRYTIYQTGISDITEISQAEEYMNKVRQKAIDEIRNVQDENLGNYNVNKEKFKVDRENLTEEKLEELKSQLFANGFCFLLKREPLNIRKKGTKDKYGPLFNLHTVITDFYLRQSDIDYIRFQFDRGYKMNLDQRFLLANQLKKYIRDTLKRDLNGYEIIQIKQKTLFEIEHINVKSEINDLRIFKESVFSFDVDISAIKSLNIKPHKNIINDLSAFVNLEYLCISGVKLCQSTFRNLKKLIKIEIYKCDLSELDFDCLNSMTSLQIIDIITDVSVSLKIDLRKLINLKWIDLKFNKREEKIFELIGSSTQLIKVRVNNTMIDFSNQLDLTALKCLDISNVGLFQQISNQWFIGMSKLIELNLKQIDLTNVDFLDTDQLESLELLRLSCNQIIYLRKGAFSKLKKLKWLNLYNNKIKELIPGVFEGLERLEHLDISSNPFIVEPIDKALFDGLKCLKNLYIRDYSTRFVKVNHLKREGLNVD